MSKFLIVTALAATMGHASMATPHIYVQGTNQNQIQTDPSRQKMNDLDWLVGEWKGSAKMGTSEFGSTASGRMVMGRWLDLTTTGDSPAGMSEGRLTLAWDAPSNMYHGYWIDNMSSMPKHVMGKMQDGGVVLTSDRYMMDGKSMTSRVTMKKMGGESKWMLTMDSDDGSGFKNLLTVTYDR